MKFKTFETRPEAINYTDKLIKQGNIGFCTALGEKFRVYFRTKEQIEISQRISPSESPEKIKEYALYAVRNKAWDAKGKIEDALSLQESMKDFSAIDDYETIVWIAKIFVNANILTTTKEVIDFLYNPDKWQGEMKQFIKDTLEDNEYDAIEGEC